MNTPRISLEISDLEIDFLLTFRSLFYSLLVQEWNDH